MAQWTSREVAGRAWSPLVRQTLYEVNLSTSGCSGVSFSLFPVVCVITTFEDYGGQRGSPSHIHPHARGLPLEKLRAGAVNQSETLESDAR